MAFSSISSVILIALLITLANSSFIPLPIPQEVVCYDEGQPRENLIPDPHNCNKFYICEQREPFRPTPTSRDCPNDHQGKPLFYNFMECACDYEHIATCYDDDIIEHRPHFFKCTTPLSPYNETSSQ